MKRKSPQVEYSNDLKEWFSIEELEKMKKKAVEYKYFRRNFRDGSFTIYEMETGRTR
jgi:hypothetical protein